jgi:hypothetical protein
MWRWRELSLCTSTEPSHVVCVVSVFTSSLTEMCVHGEYGATRHRKERAAAPGVPMIEHEACSNVADTINVWTPME